ncbi:DUF4230 domain-containing protein [Mangrovibacterium diazotrophicum]|uniref:Uncharacterized protein n=1 Tax=Mangrovibacterium diazotrophicum TaxID=1261403 RepID=A0A419W7T9_9BACT|nr:DUF4230 domain-containing protein [Mangrovibacterium diazotrophicum]RKD91551.1 hypothetical protein BC643_1907 [Mangrovibacterium diazotrophicum]
MAFLKYISSLGSLVFQVVLVIAAVVAFSWFDPFDLLAPTKRKLQNTPVQVESIREIGELITAEYYGEVIASVEEIVNTDAQSRIDTFNYRIDLLHRQFLDVVDSLAAKDLNRKQISGTFKLEYSDLLTDSLFGFYTYFIREKLKDRNYKRRELEKSLPRKQQLDLVEDLCLKRKKELRGDLHEFGTSEIQANFREVQKSSAKKTAHKRQLVLLGRGWVKAGFRFDEFSEKNFLYDNQHNRAIFIGMQPEIISATINPWFIPEEGVEGFEFVIVERKVKYDSRWTNRVKRLCLTKLEAQAISKDILGRAQSNAEDQLKHFFSLLAGEQVQEIAFYTDFLEYSADALLKDSVLSDDKIPVVEELLLEYKKRSGADFSPRACKEFIDSLKAAKPTIKGQRFQLNSRSTELFTLLKDHRLDSMESSSIDGLHRVTALDSIWCESECGNLTDSIASYLDRVNTNFENDLYRLENHFRTDTLAQLTPAR